MSPNNLTSPSSAASSRARADLLNLVRRKYPNTFIGQCYFEEMAKVYSAARAVFNRSITNDVNMRVFEVLASGSLLVTNDLSDHGLAGLFRDGVASRDLSRRG